MDRRLADTDRRLLDALAEAERAQKLVGVGGAHPVQAHLNRIVAEIEAARRALRSASGSLSRAH